jgi:hypothetical protein
VGGRGIDRHGIRVPAGDDLPCHHSEGLDGVGQDRDY